MRERDYYKEGFKSGVNWADNYRPGGPYRYTRRHDKQDEKLYLESKANAERWFEGFDNGITVRDMFMNMERDDILKLVQESFAGDE